jgi:hypothetical protein
MFSLFFQSNRFAMDKIKILSLSIIVILIVGELKECHAQFSLAKENYHPSLISPIITKGSSSLTIVSPDSNEKRITSLDKTVNVPLGIIIGTLCGVVIGGAIPSDYSVEKFSNFIKGGLIGASMGPFYTFEIMSLSRGVKNPSHKWCFTAGANIILPNYEEALFKAGYSIGIGRHYHLSDRVGLRGDVSYSLRQFILPSQKIRYILHYSERVVKCNDIDFSVGYINTSTLLEFKILSLQEFDFYLALGPSLSLTVRNDTKFHFLNEEENPDDFDFHYIIDEPDPLFGYPAMVYQLELQRGHWIWQLGFHHSVYDTDEIFPLDSNTRLRTFELSVGYKL